MKNPESRSVLDPHRFTDSIRRHPDFLNSLPKTDFRELPVDERRSHVQRAMASGALSIAETIEKGRGEYDLNANLYRLVSQLQHFYSANKTIDSLRHSYGGPKHMPYQEKDRFYDSKRQVIEFNHTLHEVINSGASQFNFNELLTFMTNIYTATSGQENAEDFYHHARTTLVGMRNEMAVEQMLINAGIEYDLGSLKQDAAGGDFIVNGVAIDVKASENSAEAARQKAMDGGYDPNTILWSHIEFDDFNGELTLPFEKSNEIFARFKPDLDRALASEHALSIAN